MTTTLRSVCDRLGHAAALLALTATVASAAPGAYKARRFDVTASAMQGGLDVTESITFEFQSGTFSKVWRDIPAARTDGIQIVGVSMDGTPLSPGDGPGHFIVSGQTRVRVEWRFAETGASVHRFDLHYVARGVVYQDNGEDVVRWTALPTEHRYRIDEARIQFEPAGGRVGPLESRRVGSVRVEPSNEAIVVDATDVDGNGWLIAELRYPAGQLTSSEPAWRTRDAAIRALAPKWALGGAAIFVIGLLAVLAIRRGYPAPETFPNDMTASEPPASLPAAVASSLAAKGRASGAQALATLFDLADRGVLRVQETRRVLGVRGFHLIQVPGSYDLAAHEIEALRTAFAGSGDDVTFAKARGRVERGGRRFAKALNAEMIERGLVDPDRKAARDRAAAVALTCVLLTALLAAGSAALVPSYGGWPFLVPLGLLLAALAGGISAATMSPLSDQGLVEAARWRGFRGYLKASAADREEGGAALPSRWIVYAVALGLGSSWSRYLRRHPNIAPEWFATAGSDPGAFAAFVGSHTGGGAGGGATGGAAGGGGSGAA